MQLFLCFIFIETNFLKINEFFCRPELKLHISRDDVTKASTHRLVWIPHVQADQSDEEQSSYGPRKSESENEIHTLVLFYDKIVSTGMKIFNFKFRIKQFVFSVIDDF